MLAYDISRNSIIEGTNEIKTLFPIYRILPLIILVEGFISIAVEILTIRQLLPVAGGSVVVTSLIIGIFLLFLALGYRKGGRIQENLQQVLAFNFQISAIWLGVGLSYVFILLFFNTIQTLTGQHIVYPLIAYLLLITAPLIYILGQTVPLTMNMAKENKSPGMLGGDTLGLSTLGSFLGAIMTALLLMHHLGVAWTVFIIFALLLILVLLLAESRFAFFSQLTIAFIAAWFIYSLNITFESKAFILTNNYANYQILTTHEFNPTSGGKTLSINNSYSSYINADKKGFLYIETIKQILFHDLRLENADILVLGAGGFTLSAENMHQNRFTYVDIDEQLKKVVVPDFQDKLNGDLIIDDARHFIHSVNKKYDAIIVDVFSNTRTIPAHLLTHEYMIELQQKLVVNGTIIFNMISKPSLNDPYSKRIDNTIRDVFTSCMVSPLTYANVITNIIYTCRNMRNQSDKTIYLDNLNTSTTDSFDW